MFCKQCGQKNDQEDKFCRNCGASLQETKNEKSNILDKIQFSDKSDNILIYTMLKKIFSFKRKFDDLKKGKFGKSKNDIEYFGVNKNNDCVISNVKECKDNVEFTVTYNNHDSGSLFNLYTVFLPI